MTAGLALCGAGGFLGGRDSLRKLTDGVPEVNNSCCFSTFETPLESHEKVFQT